MRFAGLVHPVQAAVEVISRRGKMCGSREGSDTRPTPRPPGRVCVVPRQRAPGFGRVSDKVSTQQLR
jgi:hypothetical protein